MKLTILGNSGPYCPAGGACSSYLLSDGKNCVLLDCGPGSMANLQKFCGFAELSAIALSHLHFDHISDALPLRYALDFSGIKGLPLFRPSEPADLSALFDCSAYAPRDIADADLGGIVMRTAKARHPVPGVSMAFFRSGRKFVYTGDTNWTDGLVGFCEDADLLLADAGLLTADWTEGKPHLSAALCGRLAREAKVRRLLLTHLSPMYAEEDVLSEAAAEFPAAALARIGETYEI